MMVNNVGEKRRMEIIVRDHHRVPNPNAPFDVQVTHHSQNTAHISTKPDVHPQTYDNGIVTLCTPQ